MSPASPNREQQLTGEHVAARSITRSFRSDQLAHLRELLKTVSALNQVLGPIARFNIVLDANILIAEIRWAILRRKKLIAQTDLRESILAGTVVAHVTPRVVEEVERYLPEIAAAYCISTNVWAPEWAKYKALLRISEPAIQLTGKFLAGCDPDDAPTLALAEEISASGILSRDPHIKAMGGNVIAKEFITEARDYSRKMTVYVSLHIGGYFITAGTMAAIRVLLQAVRYAYEALAKLPAPVKMVAFTALIAAILYPASRRAILKNATSYASSAARMLPSAMNLLCELASQVAATQCSPPKVRYV